MSLTFKKKIFEIISSNKFAFMLILVSQACIQATYLVLPIVMGDIIDALAELNRNHYISYTILYIVASCLSGFWGFLLAYFRFSIKNLSKNDMFQYYFHNFIFSKDHMENSVSKGEAIKVHNGVLVDFFFEKLLIIPLKIFVNIVFFLYLFEKFELYMAFIVLSTVCSILLVQYTKGKIASLYLNMNNYFSKYSKVLNSFIRSADCSFFNSTYDSSNRYLLDSNKVFLGLGQDYIKRNSGVNLLNSLFNNFSMSVIFIYVGISILEGKNSVGHLGVMLAYHTIFYTTISSLLTLVTEKERVLSSYRILKPYTEGQIVNTKVHKTSVDELKVFNRDRELNFKKGRINLLSGENGCGKSFLLKKIFHNNCRDLRVYMDNAIQTGALNQSIFFMSQKIDYLEEIRETLSDGEKQINEIERLTITDKPVIFLDECLASLSSKNKSKYANFISDLSKIKVVVMVSHTDIIKNYDHQMINI